MTVMPMIYLEKCNGCGLCIDACSRKALMLVENVVTIVAGAECGWCAECEVVCSTGAITCPFEIVIE